MKFDPIGLAVQRWQFTLLTFGMLIVLGLHAAFGIPRSEDPIFPIPDVVVRPLLPGAQPEEMELTVVAPLEDAISRLDGVEEVRSRSSDGAAVIGIHFGWGSDPERKYDEVVREVNALRPSLPGGISNIDVQRTRITNVVIVQVALVSETLPMDRLEKVAKRLSEQLAQAPGVRECRYWGAPASEVSVSLDSAKLAALRLSPTEVSDALRANGLEQPIGAVEMGQRRLNVRTDSGYRDLDRVRNTPVRAANGQVVRVGDIATVEWGQPEPTHLTRFNGQRAVFITVTQKDTEDATKVTRAVKRVLHQYKATLPPGVSLKEGFYQSDNIGRRLSRLYVDFCIALLLVLVTRTPLGFRAGVVVMVSIPISLFIAVALLQLSGFTLNQLSIAGFVLSLRLLVDDSIVITENIVRRMREGEPRISAAINGARQMSGAVLGCTATLMLAFLPLMALPGGAGAYIRSLPVAVLCTVGASLVVSMTAIPALAARVLPERAAPEGNLLLRALNHAIQGLYRPILNAAMARPWAAMAVLLGICATTVPMLSKIGFSLFPAAETPQFLVRIELPEGASMAGTDRALKFLEARLAKERDLAWQASNLGRGNPQIFYNEPQRMTAANYAEVFVSLHEWKHGESDRLLERLRSDLAAFPGAKIVVKVFENGPPVEAPIAFHLTGPKLDVLRDLAGQVSTALERTPGARDVGNPLKVLRTDLDLAIDEQRADTLGVAAGAVRRVAALALSGESVGRFRDADGDDYAVRSGFR